ncbi:hypothetical protein CHS0354_001862 [Potamilus streckersoni]|uniref:Uncharacterized protein n=1 Tax=Potamilus streckersoni TaxID=2493646 RepID=A0AAE0S6U2_9BIVA|nr:hypothetical protein CHS0354_001862 [Potamilus streckersoni]
MNILKSYRCYMSILIVLTVALILLMYLLAKRKDASFTKLFNEKRLLDHLSSLDYNIRTRNNSPLDSIPSNKWAEFQILNATGKLRLLVQEKASMRDPRLIDLIRKNYIEFPSENPYDFENPMKKDYSCGQSSYVDSLLNSELI